MTVEGPPLQLLTHRLSECPAEFLLEPRIAGSGEIHIDALVSDLIMDMGGGAIPEKDIEHFQSKDKNRRNYLRLVSIAAWLLHDDWFIGARRFHAQALHFLKDELAGPAKIVVADRFVTDPERREELARLCLDALDLRPKGESEEQADDRLESMSSDKRKTLIDATRAGLKRMREIRKAFEEQKAREAAAKYNRE